MPDPSAHPEPLRVVRRLSGSAQGDVVELHPDAGVVLKEEPGTIIWREKLADGTEAVVKLYRRGLPEWWRSRLSSFRVANEFEALRKLELLGERCTKPLFWGCGNFGSHGRGELLATEWQSDCRPLDELLATDADARRTIDLTPLWATAGRLHDAGLYHGTFLARNILVRGAAAAPQFVLLDLPRCHVFPHGIRGSRMARYDLLFMANTLRRSLPADDLPRWLTAYGMSAQQQSRFADHLRRFRNSGRLRRAIGAEFNLRAWLAGARHSAGLGARP
jgi:tRNA A-37 threonylcarbamoyl transferase component Bud32